MFFAKQLMTTAEIPEGSRKLSLVSLASFLGDIVPPLHASPDVKMVPHTS